MKIGNIDIADLRLGASQVSAWFGGVLVWGGGSPTPPAPTAEPLTFTAQEANSTVRLDKRGSPNAISLETSTDGISWSDYSWSNKTGQTVTLTNVGDKVYFRAKTENQTIGSSSYNDYQFIMSGKIAASGNIQTLLKADGTRTDVPAYCYQFTFYECSALTQAPTLPATTLANNCYHYMFSKCSSLTTAPELPATTLANNCYQFMFSSCTSLTTAPELPATTLANYCYASMFSSCTSLTTAPTLPATTLADYCYSGMFQGCSSLTTAPALPATSLASYCYGNMFKNCTSLTSAPALPATTLASYCYQYIFQGCTSLTTAPTLPATTLADYCYQFMFDGCTNLSSIEVAFTAWSPASATYNWVSNVSASGTFTCPAELPDTRGASNIPTNWTKVDLPDYPRLGLKLHFDAIDNGGVGNHLSSTTEWANIAPDTSADYKLKRTTGTWEDDSAVFTGQINECFWLNTSADVQVANFSQTGLVLSSQTYEFAFYFDPTTCQNYRGYVGKQSTGVGNGQIYIACDSSGQVNVNVTGKTASESNVQWWSGDYGLNMYPYLTQNAFNTIAITWDEATTVLTLYVNGQKIGDSTTPNGITHDTVLKEKLTLGGGMQSTYGNRVCKGKIHDFLIYSRALSDAEVAQLHDYQDARFNS